MRQFDRLFVLWVDADRRRHIIGDLWREPSREYAFAYAAGVDGALAAGFRLLPEFPQRRSTSDPYRARYLFTTFAQRVPAPTRPDRAMLLESWGVEHADDAMEVLARSGGVQVTDAIELAEYRSLDDDLVTPLEFRVAGDLYHEGAKRLALGAEVELRTEPTNPHDGCATLVMRDGTVVGYVPRQYSALLSRHIVEGTQLAAMAVRKLVVPEDRGRWVIRIARRSE